MYIVLIYLFNILIQECFVFKFLGRIGPVVARSTEDRKVRGSNPTLA